MNHFQHSFCDLGNLREVIGLPGNEAWIATAQTFHPGFSIFILTLYFVPLFSLPPALQIKEPLPYMICESHRSAAMASHIVIMYDPSCHLDVTQAKGSFVQLLDACLDHKPLVIFNKWMGAQILWVCLSFFPRPEAKLKDNLSILSYAMGGIVIFTYWNVNTRNSCLLVFFFPYRSAAKPLGSNNIVDFSFCSQS